MCYEMMIGVLEQHEIKAKSSVGYKPSYCKSKKKKELNENIAKLSSINEEEIEL